jgi:hypothetical protein
MQPCWQGAHTVFDDAMHDATVYVPGKHGWHGLHTRSVNGPHGVDSYCSPGAHVCEHTLHTASANGVHGDEAYDCESHIVHSAQLVPLPVKPGLHWQSTTPPTSMQNASGLQPPLFVAHGPTGFSGTQNPALHVSPLPHSMPQPPQLSSSSVRSTQPSGHTANGSEHETYAGCAHAASIEQTKPKAMAERRTRASVSHPFGVSLLPWRALRVLS